MGAANGFLLVLLVWTFTAFFKADDSLNITCDDVTGHVEINLTCRKINLTCRVSYQSDTCCMMVYKFMNKDKDTTVCREFFTRDPCVQLTSISCPYTANEVTTTTFKFFTQTPCGSRTTEFTVNIAGAVKEDDTDNQSALVIILSVISCLSIIIIIVGFILKRKCNF